MDLSGLGPSAAVVIVVIAFIKYMQARDEKQDAIYEKVATSLTNLDRTVGKLSTATTKNTEATISADTYLKQRNGRDIEKHAELLVATQAIPEKMQAIADTQARAIIKAVTIKEQHVEHQHVEEARIKKEIIEDKGV